MNQMQQSLAEQETDHDLSDDGEELVSDNEVALLAQYVCA
jgi:hypothetical protein